MPKTQCSPTWPRARLPLTCSTSLARIAAAVMAYVAKTVDFFRQAMQFFREQTMWPLFISLMLVLKFRRGLLDYGGTHCLWRHHRYVFNVVILTNDGSFHRGWHTSHEGQEEMFTQVFWDLRIQIRRQEQGEALKVDRLQKYTQEILPYPSLLQNQALTLRFGIDSFNLNWTSTSNNFTLYQKLPRFLIMLAISICFPQFVHCRILFNSCLQYNVNLKFVEQELKTRELDYVSCLNPNSKIIFTKYIYTQGQRNNLFCFWSSNQRSI